MDTNQVIENGEEAIETATKPLTDTQRDRNRLWFTPAYILRDWKEAKINEL